jgi:hypothetical protein
MNTDSSTTPEDAYVVVKATLLDWKAAIRHVRRPAQHGVYLFLQIGILIALCFPGGPVLLDSP